MHKERSAERKNEAKLLKKKEFHRERAINFRRKETNQTFLVGIQLTARSWNSVRHSTKEPFRSAGG